MSPRVTDRSRSPGCFSRFTTGYRTIVLFRIAHRPIFPSIESDSIDPATKTFSVKFKARFGSSTHHCAFMTTLSTTTTDLSSVALPFFLGRVNPNGGQQRIVYQTQKVECSCQPSLTYFTFRLYGDL